VVDLPRLSEAEKRAACAGALAVCQPSVNESFSIVIMEAWLEGTPVLVNAECPVTRHHVSVAGGGLYFDSAAEFVAEVRYLRRHEDHAMELGRQGKQYVLANYSWEQVIGRFENGLATVLDGHG
jgi:glycosyltransferase involved in cell wall biosynthesis